MTNQKPDFPKTDNIDEAVAAVEDFIQTIPCITSTEEGNAISEEVKRIVELLQSMNKDEQEIDAITKRLRRVLIISSIKMYITSLENLGTEVPGYGVINSELDVFNLIISHAFKYGPVPEVIEVLFEQLSYNQDTDNLLTKLIILHAPDPTLALTSIAPYVQNHPGVAEAIKELHEQVNQDDDSAADS